VYKGFAAAAAACHVDANLINFVLESPIYSTKWCCVDFHFNQDHEVDQSSNMLLLASIFLFFKIFILLVMRTNSFEGFQTQHDYHFFLHNIDSLRN